MSGLRIGELWIFNDIVTNQRKKVGVDRRNGVDTLVGCSLVFACFWCFALETMEWYGRKGLNDEWYMTVNEEII